MNTMENLREEVAQRMRNTMHGKEIDHFENDVRMEHMLGITPIGEDHHPSAESDTILDADHPFWDDWHEDTISGFSVRQHVQTAIRSLKDDDLLKVTYPYGEEAEIAYVEVETPSDDFVDNVECKECGAVVDADLSIDGDMRAFYFVNLEVDCPECEFAGVYETELTRQ